MKQLFSERFGITQPRVKDTLDAVTARGLLTFIRDRISQNWFGLEFPVFCEDGDDNCGQDHEKVRERLTALDLIWPDDWLNNAERLPEDNQVFDLVEFSFEHIARPEAVWRHDYWRHHHYNYDRTAGRDSFTSEVNRIFERRGMAFELVDGKVRRIAPTGLQELLDQMKFNTGDRVLDELLKTACDKVLDKSLKVRKEALEKLWDAWERLKTVESGSDKKEQTRALLDKAAGNPTFGDVLESEARTLTKVGNEFMIRHMETSKVPITESTHVDYLFHRMLALIILLLRCSKRCR